MAKIKSFEDAQGVEHDEAVWFPNEVHIAHSDRASQVVFAAWHSVDTLAAGKGPLPGACKEYGSKGAEYLDLAGTKESALLEAASAAAGTPLAVPADNAAVDALSEAQAKALLKGLSGFLRANTLLNVIATATYLKLVPTADTPVDPAQPNGSKQSFFAGCEDVVLPG